MKKIVLLFMMGFVINSASSQILLSEDFAYTSTGTPASDTLTNPSIGGSVWKRHSGAGTPIVWNATGLTYASYVGSNIGGAISFTNGTGSREDANIALSDSIKTGSVYLSFMLNVTASGGATGDYNVHLTSGAGSASGSFGGRVFIKDGSVANTFKLGLSKGSAAAAAVFTANDYNYNQTYLVVLKYTFNTVTGADDVVSAYILSTGVPATEPSVADLTATDMTVNDLSKTFGVAIRQGTVGTAAAILDGFRVGTSWIDAPLPTKLNSFSAVGLKDAVNVNWSALCTTNNCKFIVERSIDGVSFEAISTTSSSVHSNYAIADKNLPSAKTLYYRLRIVNANGEVAYSNIQRVQMRNIKLSVSPNPTSNEILVNASANITSVELFNLNGKLIYSNKNGNATSVKIAVSDLVEGTYLLKTIVDGETTSNKIVVKH